VAPGIATANPARLHEIVDALLESGGVAVSVEAPSVTNARRVLAERGIYVESTSGVAVAAAENLDAAGRFGTNERITIILTGAGLKR
jgi:threonine synthase